MHEKAGFLVYVTENKHGCTAMFPCAVIRQYNFDKLCREYVINNNQLTIKDKDYKVEYTYKPYMIRVLILLDITIQASCRGISSSQLYFSKNKEKRLTRGRESVLSLMSPPTDENEQKLENKLKQLFDALLLGDGSHAEELARKFDLQDGYNEILILFENGGF